MDKITIKLSDLIKLNYALENIMNNTSNTSIDSLFKFKILGILKNLENYIANYNLIRRQKIQEYGHQNKDGDIIISQDDTESIEKFNKDITPILDSNVEVEVTMFEQDEVFSKNLDTTTLLALYPIIKSK